MIDGILMSSEPFTVTWGNEDVSFKIERRVPASTYGKNFIHLGYCTFKKHPLKEIDSMLGDNITDYINVHGGITFTSPIQEDGSITYGFDCEHYNDENSSYKDIIWLKNECEIMAECIKAIAPFEDEYYNAKNWDDQKTVIALYMKKILSLKIF